MRICADLLIALFLVLILVSESPSRGRGPNIVVIIGDDHAWEDTGFLGHEFALTPNLDALAASGTAFTNAHNTASLCVPSLRTLLSGLHPIRWEQRREELEARHGSIPRREEVQYLRTLPRILAKRGYRSFEGGKMWEGNFSQAGFTDGLATHVGGSFQSIGDQFGRNGIEPLRRFLDEAGANPFFVWFAPMLPHSPFDASTEYRRPFAGRGLSDPAIAYYANLLRLDDLIGELLVELEERDLRENTLVVYVSDNGWEVGQSWYDLRTGKGTLHELGVRTPILFHLPGTVPEGVLRDDLVSTEDLFPTLLDFARAKKPRGRPGRSLHHAITRGHPAGRDVIVSRHLPHGRQPGGIWVRTRNWRYIAQEGEPEKIFQITTDSRETRNLAKEYPYLLPWFRRQAAAWDASMNHREKSPRRGRPGGNVVCRKPSRHNEVSASDAHNAAATQTTNRP